MAQSGKATLSIWLSAPPIKVGDHAFLPEEHFARVALRLIHDAHKATPSVAGIDS
jgi:hypothetical protein